MLNGIVEDTVYPDRTRLVLTGIVLPLIGAGLIAFGVLPFLVKAGLIALPSFGPVTNTDLEHALYEAVMGGAFLAYGAQNYISLRRGLPRIFLKTDGIEYHNVQGVYWAHWASLGPFNIAQMMGRGGPYSVIRSQIIGENVSPNLSKEKFMVLNNEYDRPVAALRDALVNMQGTYLLRHPDEKTSLKVSRI